MTSSEWRKRDAPALSPDFTKRVLAAMPAADAARQRRRRMATVVRPAAAILIGLVGALAGVSALPAYGADGARVAVRAVSWMVVSQSVAQNLSTQILDELRLSWLPILTAALVLTTVAFGADRRMRRSHAERPPGEAQVADSPVPHVDARTLLISLLTLVVIGAALVPAMAFGRGYVHLGPYQVPTEGQLTQTLVVLGGDATVEGRSSAPLFVVGGDARVSGSADDDVVAIGGSVLLLPGATAARDVVAIGGRVLRGDGSRVLGNVAGQELRWTGSEIRSEEDLPGALVARIRLALLGAAAGMLLAIAAVTLVPWLVVLTAATGRGAPMQSALLGLTGLSCGPLVIVPLALSLVGVPLAAILAIGLVLCWWLGAAAIGMLVGRRILGHWRRDSSLSRAALVGGGVLGALVGVPVVGGVFLVLVGAVGAGSVFLALIEGEFGTARTSDASMGMVVYE